MPLRPRGVAAFAAGMRKPRPTSDSCCDGEGISTGPARSTPRRRAGLRSNALPPWLRRASLPDAIAVYDPRALAAALGGLLELPPPVDVRHMTVAKVSVSERLAHLRAMLRHGSFTFDAAVARVDRVTVAVTLFALLELYKQGELTWTQDEPFGEITIDAPVRSRELLA